MDRARLIIDPPSNGAWNMAVDQALLETAGESGLTTFRFYQWDEPTLSLGYFQNHRDRVRHPTSLSCPLVRRRTGGGAILHDRELTYSLCIPSLNRWCDRNTELYEIVHRLIIEFLAERGIEATLFRHLETAESDRAGTGMKASSDPGGQLKNASEDPNAFMCFLRRSSGDVVLKGYKIVGSAQRRGKSALLQHGSILLEKSHRSPELPGIGDLCGEPLNVSKTIKKLTALAENQLRMELIVGMLSQSEFDTAKRIHSEQFGNPIWNLRR